MDSQPINAITIELPHHLVEDLDWLAKAEASSRSAIIADLIEWALNDHTVEGDRECAEEDRRMAEEAFPLASEIALPNPWP